MRVVLALMLASFLALLFYGSFVLAAMLAYTSHPMWLVLALVPVIVWLSLRRLARNDHRDGWGV